MERGNVPFRGTAPAKFWSGKELASEKELEEAPA